MSDLIPDASLAHLPFKAEPISTWTEETDLARFLSDLFDTPAVVIAPDGERHEGTYREYGEGLFAGGLESMREFAATLTQRSLDVYPRRSDQAVAGERCA